MSKKCQRCKNNFNSNPLIQGDDVCRTCEGMNCITFWYPRLYKLGFPTPKTIIIHTNLPLEQLEYNEMPKWVEPFITHIRDASIAVGTSSVFLRTGYLSNKHDWKNSCFLDKDTLKDDKKIFNHIVNLAEMSSIATIDRLTPIDFWAIREFIETEPYFNYFAGNMPITKERRYFIRDGKIECHHNYWDRKAFENDIDEKKFKELSSLSQTEEQELRKMANYIAGAFSGYWSVDFLKGKNGQWYLTDMAIGERSYHEKH